MKCDYCGKKNEPNELSCIKCGRMLPLGHSGENQEPLVGSSYEAKPEDNFMADYAARGRRFLLVFFLQLAVLLGLGAAPLIMAAPGMGFSPDPGMLATCVMAVAAFGMVFAAYLIAKTGESVGTGFAAHFMMALFPPFWPAVLARIGGRRVWIPYLYMALTLLCFVAVSWFFREQPMVSGILFFILLPLFIYQLCGCAVCEIGTALGYNAYVSFIWLCILPVALFLFLLRSLSYDWLQIATFVDAGGILKGAEGPSLSLTGLGAYSSISIVIILFAFLTHLFWIRSVYQNLCYPND